MRIKKTFALFFSFLVICTVIIYFAMDSTVFPNRNEKLQDNKWLHFEDRLKQLETDLNKHHEAVGEIRQALKQISSTSFKSTGNGVKENVMTKIVGEMMYNKTCSLALDDLPGVDVQMLDMYKDMKFDNPDGGVWKQGWNIVIDEHNWNKQHKLKVFVIPHSHNDPGWLKTFQQYYVSQTKKILDNMIEKLSEDPRRKFIWAEISFFSMWWDDLNQDSRDVVKTLLRNNQLEIVTGGWVMNDEANSHWLSILHQLTEGHQWLQKHFNYTPQSGWSIDPFGLSATQAILLKGVGLKNMLIQRVHYSVKKQLAKDRHLEFLWRQMWDNVGKTDIFTHMMPFYSYDIPHTCGPDPKICCQFDFKRLPLYGLTCPWRVNPVAITDSNVAQRSAMLLDQYRKKSQLYKTNVVLIPLGDDFRYGHPSEWDVQYKNYQKLFDYMNSNLKLNVHAQFGTLTDYFNAVHAEKSLNEFPVLSGDFFTYADRDDHYWSGYYTSRPFYKRMDRVLLSYIRASETILTMAYLSKKPGSKWITEQSMGLEKMLAEIRQTLSLFQHHDGITGTAKDYVVIDYAKKMLNSIKKSQYVIQTCTNILLNGPGAEIQGSDVTHYNIDDVRQSHDSLEEKYTITIGPELSTKKIVIFNSLTFTRAETVTFFVSTPFVEVLDLVGKRIKCQVSPVFEHSSVMSSSKYQLSFVVTIPAFGLISYVINAVLKHETPIETTYAEIKIFNQNVDVVTPTGFSTVYVSQFSNDFSIQNARITASFNNIGLLKAMKIGPNIIPVHLDFAKYGVRQAAERSGAYLFLPDGDAVPLTIKNTIVNVIEGSIFSSVQVHVPFVHHTVRMYNTPGADGLGLEIENVVDIEKTKNFEIVMRLSTNINSSDEFFTDLNGYQILRRKRFKKLPLQANFYPMPIMAFLEDKNYRMTLITGSPLGVSSLKPGQLEVMLDRRLYQDDNLGLGQGVMDNHPTKHIFRVLLERRQSTCKDSIKNPCVCHQNVLDLSPPGPPFASMETVRALAAKGYLAHYLRKILALKFNDNNKNDLTIRVASDSHPAGFPTLAAHVSSETLANPLLRLLQADDENTSSQPGYTPVLKDVGVDITVPSLRTNVILRNKEYLGVILHRKHLDLCFTDKVLLQQFPLSNGTVNLSTFLQIDGSPKVNEASLSFLFMKNKLEYKNDINMCPMDTKAFLIKK